MLAGFPEVPQIEEELVWLAKADDKVVEKLVPRWLKAMSMPHSAKKAETLRRRWTAVLEEQKAMLSSGDESGAGAGAVAVDLTEEQPRSAGESTAARQDGGALAKLVRQARRAKRPRKKGARKKVSFETCRVCDKAAAEACAEAEMMRLRIKLCTGCLEKAFEAAAVNGEAKTVRGACVFAAAWQHRGAEAGDSEEEAGAESASGVAAALKAALKNAKRRKRRRTRGSSS